MREAGLDVELMPWSTHGPFATDVPCAADYDRLLIGIAGPGDAPLAVYDPEHGDLRSSAEFLPAPASSVSGISLDLDLAHGDEGWTGRGHVSAGALLSPYGLMAGVDGETAAHLQSVLDGVLPGATLDEITPVLFMPETVELGFTFDFDPGEPDDLGRLRIELGDLPGGVLDELPGDVHAESLTRESPVNLRASVVQDLGLRIDTGGLEVVRAPAGHDVAGTGKAGSFEMTVEEDGQVLEIRRRLALNGPEPIIDWPALRALLLEERDPANRIILLEAE